MIINLKHFSLYLVIKDLSLYRIQLRSAQDGRPRAPKVPPRPPPQHLQSHPLVQQHGRSYWPEHFAARQIARQGPGQDCLGRIYMFFQFCCMKQMRLHLISSVHNLQLTCSSGPIDWFDFSGLIFCIFLIITTDNLNTS